MPIHEYVCAACGNGFEELVRGDEQVRCPRCDATRVAKQISSFALARGGERARAEPPVVGGGACGTCGDPRGPGSCAS
ncbi:MAG: zinc ribbon domain-containing protein [Planctomycetes bacterium]|nr:zinc ribbon domain-containing protein [Planctomycetota bacterium]